MQNINKELLPMKAHYFLFNAATGPIVQFLPIIGMQLGLSINHIGLMYTVLPISGLIAKPLFGGLADKFRIHKLLFIAFQAVVAIAYFSIYFIPSILHQEYANVTLACHSGEAFLEVCSHEGFTQDALEPVLKSGLTNASCNLSCLGSTGAYEELCNKSNITEFCDAVNSTHAEDTLFNITAHFRLNEIQKYGCLDIHVRNVSYTENSTFHPLICYKALRTPCKMTCPKLPIMDKLLRVEPKENSTTYSYQFRDFLIAAILSYIGNAVVVSIADAICIDLLGDEQGDKYGKQKMWGSIGFGIFSISGGYLVDLFSRGQDDKDYTCIFVILLLGMIFDMIVSLTLKKKSSTHTESDPSVLWELGAVAREGRVLVFVFWCIGAGMCTGVVWNFLFLHTEQLAAQGDKAWLKTLQGSLTVVQCFLGEMPFNFLSGWALKKFGHINVMSLVLLIYAVRFMAYSLITNPWLFLITELLHGPTFGFSWPTMVAYGDKIAPSGTRATMQGFVGAVFEGVGVSLGSLVCGHVMDTYGGALMFRAFSIGALVWLSIYWILQLLLRKAKAYPVHQGHNHLASYATPSDAILMTMSQELQTY